MDRLTDYILRFLPDTEELEKAIENVGKNLEGVGKKGESAMGLLDTATGGATGKLSSLYSGFKSAKAGVQSFNLGLKGTKAALISTGIGAFIVLLGEVIANWETITGFFKDKTRENALQREVDLLGQAVSKGKERLAIAQARKATAAETFKLHEDNLKNEVRQLEAEIKLAKERGDSEALLQNQNALKDKQLELTVLQTQRQTEVNELLDKSRQYLDPALKAQREKEELVAAERDRLKEVETKIFNIQDSAKYYAEQLEIAAEGSENHAYATAQVAQFQKELNDLLPQQALLQDTINAKVAEYERLKEAQAEAEKKRRREERKRRREQEAEEARREAEEAQRQLEQELSARQKLEDELYKAGLTTREREELALMELYDQRIAIAGDDEGLIKAATESLTNSLEELNDKYRAEELKKEKELQDAKIALEDELYNLSLTDYEKQELALLQAYDARIAIAGDDEGLIRAATEQLNADLEKLEKDRIDKERQLKQENVKANIQMASNAMGALMALSQAFAGDTEAEQKQAFERNKKFQTGQAIIQTAMAVTGALTAGGNPVKLATGAQFVEAGIALATGLAQIATIKKTQFESSSQGSAGGYGFGSSRTNAESAAPQLDLGFLGEGGGQTGFRSYVIASEVSNSQQANQRINDQASLIG